MVPCLEPSVTATRLPPALVRCTRERATCDEFDAGGWPKHCVAALASVFFAFGETLNLAVLVAGTETSVRAIALNLAVTLTNGRERAGGCAMWRLRRWLSRRFGRKLSYNPRSQRAFCWAPVTHASR